LTRVERLPSETQTDSRLALLRQRALVHRTLNDWHGMVTDLEAVVAVARAEDRREEEVGDLISLSWALFHSDRSRHLVIVELAVERGYELENDRLKVYALANRAYFRLDFGVWQDEELAAVAHAVAIARQARDDRPLALYRLIQSILDLNLADYAGALAAAQEVARFGLAMGDDYLHLGGQYLSTWALLALVAIDGVEVPLAAWRVYETAAELHLCQGQAGLAQDFRCQAEAGLSRLAGSLDESDPLRRSLLAHPLLQDGAAHKMG